MMSLVDKAVSASVGVVAIVFATLLWATLPAHAQVDSCANAELRTGPSAELPDCRAYEQVSPVDKNGSDVSHGTTGVATSGGRPVAPAGDAATFTSNGSFAGQQLGGNVGYWPYMARRTETGWRTIPVSRRPASPSGALTATWVASTDLRFMTVNVTSAITPDPAPFGGLYRFDTVADSVGLLQAYPSTLPGASRLASADLGTAGIAFGAALTPDAPPGSAIKLYASVDGQTQLVSRNTSNVPLTVAAAFGSHNSNVASNTLSMSNAISDDGSRIFYTSPTSAGDAPGATVTIYRRTLGATADLGVTEIANPSKRAVPDPLGAKGKLYYTASTDGNRVFFGSSELLTDDANTGPTRTGRELYRYDFAADEMIAISAETNTANGARVLGVVGTSEAGDRIYYVAAGQVIAGAGVDGQPNLYMWQDDGTADGVTTFVRTLSPSDNANWSWTSDKAARVTPTGDHLLFESVAPLIGYPNAGMTQIFLYDAATGELVCTSCNPSGIAPAGASSVGRSASSLMTRELPRSLSDDGSRVFFDSADSLEARDTNGIVDAYMWEEGEGVSLLSTGQSDDNSRFYNASANGDEAFFLTREQLVASDGDTGVDLYVAKVGGGIPQAVPPTVCDLLADGCQSTGSGVPSPVLDGTAASIADGNLSPGARTRLAVARPSARARRRAAARGVLVLRVRTNKAGRVAAVARARLRGRVRRVAVARRVVASDRTAPLRLRLSEAARRQLRSGATVRLTVRVTRAGTDARSMKLSLRRSSR